MASTRHIPLKHLEVNLEGALRLSHQKPTDGSRLRFDNGSRIDAERITDHASYHMQTGDGPLGPLIRTKLDKHSANAFSVQPYTGKIPSRVGVKIYSVRDSPTN